ncbi:MAG: zinc metallopeptidase [Bacteroidota bacterium]
MKGYQVASMITQAPVETGEANYYNTESRTVHLLPSVYFADDVQSAAAASHEAFHSLQHRELYMPLTIARFVKRWYQWIVLAIAVLWCTLSFTFLMTAWIQWFMISYVVTIHIAGKASILVTEWNASARALIWLRSHYDEKEVLIARASLRKSFMSYIHPFI